MPDQLIDKMKKDKSKLSFSVNLGLLIFGLVMTFSGFVVQFKYHMGQHAGAEKSNSVLGLNYNGWTSIHKISIILISILVSFHFFLHWKWYKTVINKKLLSRNKLQILLLIVFILVAITGYIPWIISLISGPEIIRNFFIEMHDKLAILLFVFLTIHVTSRLKWYIISFDRLKNKHSA